MRLGFKPLFLCCCASVVLLICCVSHATQPASGVRILEPLKGRTPRKALRRINATSTPHHRINVPLYYLNWTSCPTMNELRSQSHFSLWDAKLFQALGRFGQGEPKTEQESWHAVTDNIHAFTAFLTYKPEHVIYITSLVRGLESDANETKIQHPPLVCLIRTSNGTVQREARVREVWTWLNPDFMNALIVCPPPNNESTADENIKVAIAVRGSAEQALRWLQLHRVPDRAQEKCCAVCVRPTYGSSLSLWKIVEFIVHHKLMGASKFYFYDLDMPLGMKLLLAWLQYNGVDVTLVPFKLIADNAQVHARGQIPALYDCMFRSRATTEYYMHVDIDELIIPRRHSSIPAIIEKVERERNDMGSILIPSRYHCAEYPLNKQYFGVDHLPLQTRLYPYHFKELFGTGFSKYIARSRTVSEAGVHDVVVHHTGYSMKNGYSSLLFMNHYRRCCEFPPDSCVVKDKLDLRYFVGSPDTYSFVGLAARIENDEIVRALKKLIKQVGSAPL